MVSFRYFEIDALRRRVDLIFCGNPDCAAWMGEPLLSTKITLLRSWGLKQKEGKRSTNVGIGRPKHPVTRVKTPTVSETRRRLD